MKKVKFSNVLLAIVISLGLSACGGSKFSEVKRKDIKQILVKGKTTSDDVEKSFGEPNGVEMTTLADALSRLGVVKKEDDYSFQLANTMKMMTKYQNQMIKNQQQMYNPNSQELNSETKKEVVKEEPKMKQSVELWTYSENKKSSGVSALSYVPVVNMFARGSDSESKNKTLKLIFDDNGTLIDYRYMRSTKKTSSSFGLM